MIEALRKKRDKIRLIQVRHQGRSLQFHDLIGTLTHQGVALDKLFMDVALYSGCIMGAGLPKTVPSSAAGSRSRVWA